MAACLRFIQMVWKTFIDIQGHAAQCYPNLIIIKATPGLVESKLKIESYNLNTVGIVHGGLIMSLTDTVGSLAIASKGYYMTGVSTDISISFVQPAGKAGEFLYAKAMVTSLGKNVAHTRVDFTNENGDLVAYGSHTKYVGKSSSSPNNVKFSEDGEKVIEGADVENLGGPSESLSQENKRGIGSVHRL